YDQLLPSFSVDEIQSAIHWMKLRGYISSIGIGIISPDLALQLTQKGRDCAESRSLQQDDRRRLSGKAVTIRPSMYGFSLDLKESWWRTKKWFSREKR